MNLSAVKERLEANQTPCYRSPAHFVSDIRLRLGNGSALSEVPTKEPFSTTQFLTHDELLFPRRR